MQNLLRILSKKVGHESPGISTTIHHSLKIWRDTSLWPSARLLKRKVPPDVANISIMSTYFIIPGCLSLTIPPAPLLVATSVSWRTLWSSKGIMNFTSSTRICHQPTGMKQEHRGYHRMSPDQLTKKTKTIVQKKSWHPIHSPFTLIFYEIDLFGLKLLKILGVKIYLEMFTVVVNTPPAVGRSPSPGVGTRLPRPKPTKRSQATPGNDRRRRRMCKIHVVDGSTSVWIHV